MRNSNNNQHRFDRFWGIGPQGPNPAGGNIDLYFPEGIDKEVEAAAKNFWRRRGKKMRAKKKH
ncbi:hypothetical protein [Kiloniella litopenaei]|uniref:hypothetical protein n=1 Tax=Kiloniella litopenaei TaxID=1549748 RepID=UPI003BA8EE94|tara:strand:+ start:773 stop:961 length:189 start_codon:yes stop_codon:yes gene_type:complete